VAFPSILSVTPTDSTPDIGSATTSYALNLPAIINAGDVLIAAIHGGFNVTSVAWDNATAGTWTLVGQIYRTDAFISVYKRVADGTEDGKTLTLTLGVAGRPLGMVYRIGGATGNTNAATQSNGFASSFAWPTVTASWGVKDNLMLGLAGLNRDKTSITPSADYAYGTAMRTGSGTTGIDQSLTAYYQQRNLAAATETAGSVTVSPSGASARVFIILEPAADVGPSPITGTMAGKLATTSRLAIVASSSVAGNVTGREAAIVLLASSGQSTATGALNAKISTTSRLASSAISSVSGALSSKLSPLSRLASSAISSLNGSMAGSVSAASTFASAALSALSGALSAFAEYAAKLLANGTVSSQGDLDAPYRSTIYVQSRKTAFSVASRIHSLIVPSRKNRIGVDK